MNLMELLEQAIMHNPNKTLPCWFGSLEYNPKLQTLVFKVGEYTSMYFVDSYESLLGAKNALESRITDVYPQGNLV